MYSLFRNIYIQENRGTCPPPSIAPTKFFIYKPMSYFLSFDNFSIGPTWSMEMEGAKQGTIANATRRAPKMNSWLHLCKYWRRKRSNQNGHCADDNHDNNDNEYDDKDDTTAVTMIVVTTTTTTWAIIRRPPTMTTTTTIAFVTLLGFLLKSKSISYSMIRPPPFAGSSTIACTSSCR